MNNFPYVTDIFIYHFSFVGSNGASGESITVIEANTYQVTVTSGTPTCLSEASYTLLAEELVVSITGRPYQSPLGDENNVIPELSVLPETQLYCPGQSFLLGVNGEFDNVEWSTNVDINLENLPPNTALFTPSMSGGDSGNSLLSVTVTVTDENGCMAESTVTFEEADNNPTAVQDFLANKGFYCIDITVEGVIGITDGENDFSRSLTGSPCEDVDCPDNVSGCVRDEAGLSFSIDGEVIDNPEVLIESFLAYFEEEFGYEHTRAYITKDENLCGCTDNENFLEDIETNFNANELAFWVNISEISGKLCILANVPTSDIHIPVSEARKAFLDASLIIAAEDGSAGSLANEAEQRFFALFDGMLDNYLSTTVSNEEEDRLNTSYVCEGALLNNPSVISPAGYQMTFNGEVSLDFVPDLEYRGGLMPNGALINFTDWTGVTDNPGERRIYEARFDMSGVNEESGVYESSRFAGYFRARQKAPPEESYEPLSQVVVVGSYDDQLSPSTVTLNNGNYIGSLPIPLGYPIDGSGLLYGAHNFHVPSTNQVGVGPVLEFPLIPISSGYPVIDSDIEIVDLSPPEIDGENIFFALTHADGRQSWVLGTYNVEALPPTFEYYLWNCYTGSYDEQNPIDSDIFPDEIKIEMDAFVSGQEFNGENLTGHNFEGLNEEEILTHTPELGESYCFELSAQQAQKLGMSYQRRASGYWPEDITSNVLNYAQLDDLGFLDKFQDEVSRVENWGDDMDIRFILTADENLARESPLDGAPNNFPIYLNSPGEIMLDGSLIRNEPNESNNIPDMQLGVHYKENGGLIVCLRFADDMYRYTNMDYEDEQGNTQTLTEIPLVQSRLIQAIAFERWKEGLVIASLEEDFGAAVDHCEVFESCTEPGSEKHPWRFGKRNGAPDFTLINLTGEIGAVSGDFMKDGELSDRLWVGSTYGSGDNLSLFELPEAGVGVGNAVASENPIVGFYQLGTFGFSYMNDQETYDRINESLGDLSKLAMSIYENKKAIYTEPGNEEKKWHEGAKDVTATIFLLFNASKLLTKIGDLGKKADVSAQKISDEVGLDTDADFARLREELTPENGFTEGDIKGFWKYMGDSNFSPAVQQKLLKNPFLARWWKKFKDDFPNIFCDITPFQGGGETYLFPSGGERIFELNVSWLFPPCPDFKTFVNNLPDVPHQLYGKLEQNFPITEAGMTKASKLVEDAADAELWNNIKTLDNGLDAWDALHIDGTGILRKNANYIKDLSDNLYLINYFKNNVVDAAVLFAKKNDIWGDANAGYGFVSNVHKTRMDAQWQRMLKEANTSELIQLFTQKVDIMKEVTTIRQSIKTTFNLSSSARHQLKAANIFYGTRRVFIDGTWQSQNFVAISCGNPSLINLLTSNPNSLLNGRKIIPRASQLPPSGDPSGIRYLRGFDEARAYDSELNVFEDWLDNIHNSPLQLDWNVPGHRVGIRQIMQQDADFNSWMTPCSSCTGAFNQIFGEGTLPVVIGDPEATSLLINGSTFVKSAVIFNPSPY